MAAEVIDPMFFPTPEAFRSWLEANHDTATVLWVGFYRTNTGCPSITWPESVDQALCYGWIDGIRKRLSDEAYAIRFSPRQSRSTWSAVNIRRAAELIEAGLMCPPGLAAYQQRGDEGAAIYSYEQRRNAEFDEAQLAAFRANPQAWAWFQQQSAWYRRAAAHWVISAKREQTRQARLATLIDDCANGRKAKPLSYAQR